MVKKAAAAAAPKKTAVTAAKKPAAAASAHKKDAPAAVTKKQATPKAAAAKKAATKESAPKKETAAVAAKKAVAAPKKEVAPKKETAPAAAKKAAPAKKDTVPAKKAAPAKKVAAAKAEPTKKVAASKKKETPSAVVKDIPKASGAAKEVAVESKAVEASVPAKKAAAAPVKKAAAAKKGGKKSVEQQLAKLQGAEWDSDDEDAAAASAPASKKEQPELNFEANVDFVELTKKTKQNLAKSKGAAAAATEGAGATQSSTIFIGRIPHGFYEKQMRGFFSQFGDIKRLKVSRNKKSGKSKHYAFIEFEEADIARVVADTMDGYRLFDKSLSCNVLPVDKCHERMFIGANRTFRPIPYRKLAIREHNAPKTFEQQEANNARLLAKESIKRNKFKALGIEYDFEGYAGTAPAKSSHVKF
ncbi:hypothetical protein DYB25_004352 [Aphanomyces astaci]|uniref:RRM domain-containing protein n=1 Tax=Aphanomyces astaci TaxID=112090 RepID=A0A397AVQ8_APHAT|nr:hypothetical protein DYB25_004352 [Aphanomyces astaci]RHY16215.1 hypothetical protein DYB36_005250 [Aphanomyces astaci]RHY53144.1 hypothetical protein DYB38_004928 [Aphanomyces astaci]RHY60569.1 hypothetical protein DYB34_005011 [Aphanomyces astaci]